MHFVCGFAAWAFNGTVPLRFEQTVELAGRLFWKSVKNAEKKHGKMYGKVRFLLVIFPDLCYSSSGDRREEPDAYQKDIPQN